MGTGRPVLEEFTENLVIGRASASGCEAVGSSEPHHPEPLLKFGSENHNVFTHFPKDLNFEICKIDQNFKCSLQRSKLW